MKVDLIPIVVFTNRKDFYLAKICIASIRFYYPKVEIFLVKDLLNGPFCTRVLRKTHNVKLIKLSKRYFGWSAAKIHFLLNEQLDKKRFLCIDADIIFLGRVLDKLVKNDFAFVVHPSYVKHLDDLESQQAKQQYFDINQVKKVYKQYHFPGYFFNGGQTVVTPGLIDKNIFAPCFDLNKYPYYKNRQLFPTVDQSILNAIFATIPFKIGTVDFMRWSVNFFNDKSNLDVTKFSSGDFEYLLHYAGDLRSPDLNKMRGTELLSFFQDLYRKKLNVFQRKLDVLQNFTNSLDFLSRILYFKNRILIKLLY